MRVKITHLKAPWPLGAVVGDVLELLDSPAWATGKFEAVGDDVEATIAYPAPVDAEAEALALAEKKAAEELAINDAKATAKAEAEALGIVVDGRWSAARIAEEVAKKLAE